jgi:hypothetical protein
MNNPGIGIGFFFGRDLFKGKFQVSWCLLGDDKGDNSMIQHQAKAVNS